jgi:hypothetical protein
MASLFPLSWDAPPSLPPPTSTPSDAQGHQDQRPQMRVPPLVRLCLCAAASRVQMQTFFYLLLFQAYAHNLLCN